MNVNFDDYGLANELKRLVDEGALIPLTPKPEEKTLRFMFGRDYTLIWIHPDHNAEFCHYYTETPGDLPNFYVFREYEDAGDEFLDIDTLDDLLWWIEVRREEDQR